jgi:alanyl-tRNA synthetase
MEAAKELGALMFFGDKYGDMVRVLEAGPHSTELCGGTHVGALGDIGTLKVVSEGSIGSNMRRIEAVTGLNTLGRLRHDERILGALADLVSAPVDDLVEGVERRLAEAKDLRNQVTSLRRQLAVGQAAALAAGAVDGAVVARVDGVERDTLRDLAVAVRDRGVTIVVLGAVFDGGGVGLVAASAPGGPDAGAVLSDAASTIGGGGRKNPELTVIGGKDAASLDAALDQARAAISGS